MASFQVCPMFELSRIVFVQAGRKGSPSGRQVLKGCHACRRQQARRAEVPRPPEAVPCPLLEPECAGGSPQCLRRRRSKSHEEEPPAGCRGWHHHYRHRERDLERQRAMRQVASWIEREQLAGPPPPPAQRHEHHHLHEHVHHHYHHYVD